MSDEAGVDFYVIQKGDGKKFPGFLTLSVSHVLVRQGSATSDGFLSSTEYSMWASTMKLQEDEAHPTLKESHFMSLPNDLPPQVSFFFSFFLVQL